MFQRQKIAIGVLVLALLLGALVLPVMADNLKGKIASVRPTKNEIVVTETFKNWTFQLDKGSRVFINNQESKLTDLKAGDEAIVTFDRLEERFIAREVRASRK